MNINKHNFSLRCSRVGNFIIGASVSDKQMLRGSSGACAASTVSVVNKTEKVRFVLHRINPFVWRGTSEKGERSAMLSSFNLFSNLT